jgi:alpha/beta superfamily hydrolase
MTIVGHPLSLSGGKMAKKRVLISKIAENWAKCLDNEGWR